MRVSSTTVPDCNAFVQFCKYQFNFNISAINVFTASAEPTSAPLDLFIEDKNDTSVTIIWSQPEVVGHSGLDGYTIEICKDGSRFCFSPGALSAAVSAKRAHIIYTQPTYIS